MAAQCNACPENTECDVKNVICRRTARQTFFGWNHKSQNTDQNQNRGKNDQRQIIDVIENHRVALPGRTMNYLTSINSTSNINVALGGISGGAPCAPYPR